MIEKLKAKKRVVIVSNGQIGDEGFYREIIKKADFIIAANGGGKHLLRLNIIPDLIIGDLDSLDEENLSRLREEKADILSYPRNKDKSDTQLALEYALDRKASKIVILGAFGDRIDHTLANLHLLMKGVDRGIDLRLMDDKHEVLLVDKSVEIKGRRGTVISLLPLSSCVEGIFTEGLKYPLEGGKMEIGNPYGISNEFLGSRAKIGVNSGYLLAIKVRQ
jgi:thiamine pyrophosphokinase